MGNKPQHNCTKKITWKFEWLHLNADDDTYLTLRKTPLQSEKELKPQTLTRHMLDCLSQNWQCHLQTWVTRPVSWVRRSTSHLKCWTSTQLQIFEANMNADTFMFVKGSYWQKRAKTPAPICTVHRKSFLSIRSDRYISWWIMAANMSLSQTYRYQHLCLPLWKLTFFIIYLCIHYFSHGRHGNVVISRVHPPSPNVN